MDIVERLRAWADSFFPPTMEDLFEAADEIERLREALQKIGEGDTCTSLMTHPPICKRAYDARAALKIKETP